LNTVQCPENSIIIYDWLNKQNYWQIDWFVLTFFFKFPSLCKYIFMNVSQ
jgi:hypothetical protein